MTLAILRSFTWTYLSRSVAPLFAAVAVVVGGPLAFRGLLALDGLELDPEALEPFPFVMTYLWGGGLVLLLAGWIGHQGLRRSNFVLPISTRALGTWQMVSTAVAVAGVNVLAQLLLGRWLGVEWPVWGPTLFLATLAVMAYAIGWNLLDFRFWKACVALGVVIAASWWLESRFLPGGRRGEWVPWVVSMEDVLVMVLAVAASFWFGLRALERDRHGRVRPERQLEQMVVTSDDDLLSLVTRGEVATGSREAAFAWMLWARTRLIAAGGAALFLPVCALLVVGMFWDVRRQADAEVLLSLVFVFSGIGGCLLGMVATSGNLDRGVRSELPSAHVATMPISDRAMGRAILLNAVWAVLLFLGLVLAIGVVPLLTAIGFFGIDSTFQALRSTAEFARFGFGVIALQLAGCLVLCWTLTGVCGTLTLTGRRWLVGTVFFGGCGASIVAGMVLRFVLPEEARETATLGLMGALAAAVVLGTVLAYVQACRRGLIGWPSIAIGLVAWTVVGGVLGSFVEPLPGRWIVMGLSSLVALPLAGMPLAMRWNRHR